MKNRTPTLKTGVQRWTSGFESQALHPLDALRYARFRVRILLGEIVAPRLVVLCAPHLVASTVHELRIRRALAEPRIKPFAFDLGGLQAIIGLCRDGPGTARR